MDIKKLKKNHDKIAESIAFYNNLAKTFDSGLTADERNELLKIVLNLEEDLRLLKNLIMELESKEKIKDII